MGLMSVGVAAYSMRVADTLDRVRRSGVSCIAFELEVVLGNKAGALPEAFV